MNIIMDDSRLTHVSELRSFLKAAGSVVLSLADASIEEKYTFIDKTLDQFRYHTLKRKDKHVVITYLRKVTGYKNAQLYRLIIRADRGKLQRFFYHRVHPHRIYTAADIKRLETTDELHLRLSDMATKEILRREFEVFGHRQFQTISSISHSHISNLRHSNIYNNSWVNHTKARVVPIGITMPPQNFGRPGSIRVDAVSQRDVFHINSVDEITQWEVIVCVPQITEYWMIPAFEAMFDQYPFVIFNFHSDRGGENINYQVTDLLQRLLIKQTKSRSNHCNDNALVETKNGSVVRKNMGWEHINEECVDLFNTYYRNYFNPYLNFHRPCAYPTIKTDEKGKKRKVYIHYHTPYDALKGITDFQKFLKPGVALTQLDTIAMKHSDNEWAKVMREEERILWETIRKADHKHGSQRRR